MIEREEKKERIIRLNYSSLSVGEVHETFLRKSTLSHSH